MKLTEEQQGIWQELAHQYAIFWNTESSVNVRRDAGDKFQALVPHAREKDVDIDAVCRSVDEMKENARLAEILQEQYDNNPEQFAGVRPGLLKRFVLTRKEQ